MEKDNNKNNKFKIKINTQKNEKNKQHKIG